MSGKGVGLDIGTNMIVAATLGSNGNTVFKQQRDSFFRILPKTEVNKKSIKLSLDKRGANYIIDEDGSFIVVGEDALEMAIERNDKALRPMSRGVISPKEKSALPILKLIIESMIGQGENGDKCIFSVPAKPIDTSFDIVYHTEMMGLYIRQMGYESSPINEAFAVALSELLDEGLTGISASCLVPGTKIYTDRGILNIEDVIVGDSVITHEGRFKKITNVITKNFNGLCTKLQILGYSDNTENYKFVDNHELYVNRDGRWVWVGCEDIVKGDIVGEPILKQEISKNGPTITICERVTSSNDYTKKHIRVSPDVQRLIGYFLGDGSICERDSGIQFDFGVNESSYIDDVSEILNKNFGKEVNIKHKGDNCIRLKCYSRGIASWFRNNCYDKEGNKRYPWSLDRINYSSCLNLLSGLIRSDGSFGKESIVFYNTSTNLIILVKQLFSRLGVAASIAYRKPREHIIEGDRLLVGIKDEWAVSSGKKSVLNSLYDLIKNINCDNSSFSDKLFIYGDFCCSRVQKIDHEDYSGVVYDLQVEDDHSFSGPYLTIHNCGAGMTNICVIHEGDPLIEFSLTRGGDFIDQSVGNALDVSPSLVQLEKEAGVDLFNPTSKIMEAVSVYYNSVINYTLQNIAYELKQREKELPLFRDAVPIVFSGGLTLADGFIRKVEEALLMVDFPIKIGQVKRASDPMRAVAAGALLAASL